MRHISYKSILAVFIISFAFTSLSPSILYAEGASDLGGEDISVAENDELADSEVEQFSERNIFRCFVDHKVLMLQNLKPFKTLFFTGIWRGC